MPDGESCRYKMGDRSNIMFLKFQIKLKTGIPRHEQRLIFSDETLEDRKSFADYGIMDGDTVHLQLRVLGSAKRPREDGDKDTIMASLRTDYTMKANALIETGEDVCVHTGRAITARAGDDHRLWFTQQMNTLATPALKELRDNVKLGTNMEQKIRHIAKALFAPTLLRVSSLEIHFKTMNSYKEGLIDVYTQYVMVSIYCNTNGSMNWEKFLEEMDGAYDHRIRNRMQ